MKHDWSVLVAVFADIGCIEAIRQNAVALNCAHLPGAANRVGEVPFEFGRVKGTLARQLFPAIVFVRHARLGHSVAQLLLGLVPIRFAAETLLGPKRELNLIGEAEILVDAVGQLAEGADLLNDLLFSAEDVRIILRKLAHTHQTVERSVRFVAMATAHLAQADRQVAIGRDALFEDENMRGAVHRLQGHPVGLATDDGALVFDIGHLVGDHEHILAIFAPVARLLPLARVHHLRCLDLAIAARVHLAPHIGFELTPDLVALGMPENAAMRFFLQVEQIHLAAQLAVVALGGLFQPHQMLLELFLVEPGGAVNARQLRVLLVAAPIGAGRAHKLEGLRIKLAGRSQMRSAAHVEPRALTARLARPVDRQLFIIGQGLGPFGLERLTFAFPLGDQRLARPRLAHKRFIRLDDLAHLLLNDGKIFEAKRFARFGSHHIIVEAIRSGRAKRDLRARPQGLHRFGQNMREIVAHQFKRVGLVFCGDDGKLCVALERAVKVAHFPIHARGHRGLGKARANRSGNVGRGGAGLHFAHRTIRQVNLQQLRHRCVLFFPSASSRRCFALH